ncbi:hypothetical protein CHS0354_011618 [Potamilus streckersoni]|uniref:Radial spoke head 10 homolog B-like n=1 Tax=Potamilus streckersoni TaxID=2493646 RepID=A0AAE0TKA7_9BIVA|nr:hypothetical protein CHS0354_011618 [Potamilus streckersoni]
MAAKNDGKPKKGEKRSAKKHEETPSNADVTEEIQVNTANQEKTIEVVPKESIPDVPEPVYDEPVLSEIIIESYEGEKVRGLYEGEGIAHFTSSNVYKGQFSEGFMHGKGEYIWMDGMKYEGDFYRNQITGKGVYYWPDGSYYEGDVLNGKRHGVGTYCFKDNKMSYAGDWFQGKRHGKGRLDYDSEGKSFYDGDWVNNVRHGMGTRQYPSGNLYQGMWFNNVRHGEGTMKWLDRDQIYSGQWENGIQHGMGQHIWLLHRVHGSQFPLRNMYDGEFVSGLRHGFGVFHYANGARYDGGWRNNMKHGKGKFYFKNGRIYQGLFEKDHIVEYPDFTIDGMRTPDLSHIRTRSPMPIDNASVHSNESRNTTSPSFQLDIDCLLNEFTESDKEEEVAQVQFVITRYISNLRRIYNYYSCLGYEDSPDNTYIMNKMQFWRFIKDCRLHHREITLMEMDRLLVSGKSKSRHELHNPYDRILLREFINNLIIISYHLFHEEHEGTSMILTWCLSKLINDNILRYACNVHGHFYYETRRAVNALVHLDQSYEIYQSLCTARKYPPQEQALKMRQFLFMIKDLKLINNDLTARHVIDILAEDDPNVADGEGCYNLELEMTFLEFFEALIGCAEVFVTEAVVKDPTTPRPSTTMTRAEESMLSMGGSPSRITSQAGLDEQSVPQGSPREGSPETGSPGRAASSAGGTTKTGGNGSSKVHENHPSVSNLTAVNSEGGQAEASGQYESSKDVQQMADHHKSGSYISNHTNASDDHVQLIQSSVSIGGHTYLGNADGEEDGEGKTSGDEEEEPEEELDECNRQFNFWTHQIHIFFVRKFFPAAEKMNTLKHAVERRKLEEAKMRAREEAESFEVNKSDHTISQDQLSQPLAPAEERAQA